MNRRSFITKLLPMAAAALSLPAGAAVIERNKRYVLVCDKNLMSAQASLALAKSLDLPKDTAIIRVFCSEGQRPEDAFAIMEAS